ncbi:MAG TPA: DMT family transporter [Patescibacteria group bacterium]|nr:DMT family transporter [Patescibacteria group bacterium]
MPWLFFALLGPILWALSMHIDKYLVERYFKNSSVTVLMVFTALMGLLALPFIAWIKPQALAIHWSDALVMAISGILYMAAMLFYLRALQSEEASVVAPLFLSAPIYTFLLAFLFLGEIPSSDQLLGSVLILAGAFLLSWQFGAHRKRRIRMRLIFFMTLCVLAFALGAVVFKFFAVRDEFWGTTFWTLVGEALFGLVIIGVPVYFKQLVRLIQSNAGAVLGVNGANELINLAAGLVVRYASLFAPLGLVQAVSSTTALFVFVFGIMLTIFFPHFVKEDLSWKNLMQKGAAAILITAGILAAHAF